MIALGSDHGGYDLKERVRFFTNGCDKPGSPVVGRGLAPAV